MTLAGLFEVSATQSQGNFLDGLILMLDVRAILRFPFLGVPLGVSVD